MTQPVTTPDGTDRPTRRPGRGSRAGTARSLSTSRAVRASAESGLAKAVAAALGRLPEIDRAGGRAAHTRRCQVETLLRDAVERHRVLGAPDTAVPAVRVACAHLGAGDLEDAYLALLTARDLLR